MRKLKSFALLLFSLFSLKSFSQQSPTTAGGDAAGSGGSASYSIGQIVHTTHTGINGSMSQGIQQPYEISVILGNENIDCISLAMKVFPNPTVDFLLLSIDNYKDELMIYQLSDLSGKILQSSEITDSKTEILMKDLAPSTYFLKVRIKNNDLKTFRIFKGQ